MIYWMQYDWNSLDYECQEYSKDQSSENMGPGSGSIVSKVRRDKGRKVQVDFGIALKKHAGEFLWTNPIAERVGLDPFRIPGLTTLDSRNNLLGLGTPSNNVGVNSSKRTCYRPIG